MKLYVIICLLYGSITCWAQLPQGFVYLDSYSPDIQVELRYYGSNNFVGRPVAGYESPRLILTVAAAKALKEIQKELAVKNMCLRIYDGYRPQRAVNDFIQWARKFNDTINKALFYPKISKSRLFNAGYIASRSGHSRGSTVDLTLVDSHSNMPLDMGSPYDFFGEISGINYKNLTEKQKTHRRLLKLLMEKHGFRSYAKEWWHFTLRGEPFPKTYFDFVIK